MRRFKDSLCMIPCSDCSIGQMRQTTVTYFTFVGERMITVPDFSAWVCDMCGKCEYDLEALDNLALQLCPRDTDRPAKRRPRAAAKGKTPRADTPSISEK